MGDKVKVRVPPTAAQLEETGRCAKHVTTWRGPCIIVERLSQTAYVAVDDASQRRYERVLSNLLPYHAWKAKANADAAFSPYYSDPFTEGELIAVRDDPTGPFFIARVTTHSDGRTVARALLRLHGNCTCIRHLQAMLARSRRRPDDHGCRLPGP